MNGYKHDEIEIKDIYEYFKNVSRNFTYFHPKFIRINPRILLLFRLYLDLNQIEFSKLISRAKSTVSYYENCISSPTIDSATEIQNKLLPIVKFPLNLNLLEERFKKQLIKSKGFSNRNRAIELAYKSNINWKRKQENGVLLNKNSSRTKQELIIEKALKENNIFFVSQAVLVIGKSPAGAIISDFLINNNVVIEATTDYLNPLFSKESKKRAIRIAYRGFRIKKYFPYFKTILFLSQSKIDDKCESIIKESFDHIVTNNDINELISIINENSTAIPGLATSA